jgi:predicted MFS family arabinose efflux permease
VPARTLHRDGVQRRASRGRRKAAAHEAPRPLPSLSPVAALASAAIFGSAFMAGPAAVTAISRHVLPPGAWTAGVAVMTTGFALGQAVGPLVSGLLSDGSGGLKAGLWLSPILLAAAAAVSLFQAHHPHHTATRA